jgi:hypothetical protein
MSALAPQIGDPSQSVTGPASQEVPTDWKSLYPPEAWKRIRAEGIYLGCVLSFAVVVSAILLKINLASHDVVQRFLCCALGGIAGSWIYSMKWYVRAISHHLWRHDLVVWRITSPFMGIFLSVSAYAVLNAGLLGITLEQNPRADPKLYAYAVGFLTGLCSDVVMGKLTEVAETLFGRTTSRHAQKP